LPRDLIAAELFGHTRGAFSGAAQARRGVIASASGGTLLLDEVGDCPPEVQMALLRVLQEKAVRPVGAEQEQPVDVRFVAATHRPLEEMVASGAFRADLYARLSQVKITLAPLRERKAELPELAKVFCEAAGGRFACSVDAAEALLAWNWPFNVRELETLAHSFVVAQGPQGVLDLDYLRTHHKPLARSLQGRLGPQQGPFDRGDAIGETPVGEPRRLRALLAEHHGNVSEVARALGKPRSQIYRWMKALGTGPGRFRA
jgi:transcriptional regulator with GAF, ATPase, and Fis domain